MDNPLIPNNDDKRVLSFCKSLSPDNQPFYVMVQPEPGFSRLQCFPNVAKKVEMSGGEIVYGWEISQFPKIYLEARFHAVWRSQLGNYLDITPEETGQQRILFLPDARHTKSPSTIERRRFILARDVASAERYLKLADELIGLVQSDAWGGIQMDNPAIQRHISGLKTELKRLQAKLLG